LDLNFCVNDLRFNYFITYCLQSLFFFREQDLLYLCSMKNISFFKQDHIMFSSRTQIQENGIEETEVK